MIGMLPYFFSTYPLQRFSWKTLSVFELIITEKKLGLFLEWKQVIREVENFLQLTKSDEKVTVLKYYSSYANSKFYESETIF